MHYEVLMEFMKQSHFFSLIKQKISVNVSLLYLTGIYVLLILCTEDNPVMSHE